MKTFGITHIGLVREINEDNYFMSKEPIGKLPNLFIIADGMGGHNAGEVASKLAVEGFVNYVKNDSSTETIEGIFIKATQYANNVIYEKAIHTSEMNGMGTTMVACSLIDDILYVINIGDSRLYVIDQALKQVTIDHSYVEELIRVGEITRDESIHHPAKNKITRALGIVHHADPDIYKLRANELTKIFLCSDGLTTMVRDERIFEALSSNIEIREQGNMLVDEAINNGGTDNITLLIIDIKN